MMSMMSMMSNNMFIILVISTSLVISQDTDDDIQLKAFTNIMDGKLNWGNEDKVLNYVELAEDPKGIKYQYMKQLTNNTNTGSLPAEFTVCSSLHMKNMVTKIYFFQLYTVNIF